MQAHASVIGNCICCISGDDGLPGLILNLARIGSMGTNLFCLANVLLHLSIKAFLTKLSLNLIYIIDVFFCSYSY